MTVEPGRTHAFTNMLGTPSSGAPNRGIDDMTVPWYMTGDTDSTLPEEMSSKGRTPSGSKDGTSRHLEGTDMARDANVRNTVLVPSTNMGHLAEEEKETCLLKIGNEVADGKHSAPSPPEIFWYHPAKRPEGLN